MSRIAEGHSITARERARKEIEKQVQEFLKKGGKIESLNSPLQNGAQMKGAIWRDDFSPLV